MSPASSSIRGLWRLHGSTSETSATTHTLIAHCQHEVVRQVIAPLPNSSWVLVSEGRTCWIWETKGQMSGYPIPHGEHY
jgi:hypothetical protein